MHIENELVEIMTTDEHEFEEVVEEYEEEILMQEVSEPPLIDSVDTAPAQDKPRCITLILIITLYMCVLCIYFAEILWKPHAMAEPEF
jgi:hypothetical protein